MIEFDVVSHEKVGHSDEDVFEVLHTSEYMRYVWVLRFQPKV